METAGWITAISTSVIALVLVLLAALGMRAWVVLKREVSLEKNPVDSLCQTLLKGEQHRYLPVIVRSLLLGTAIWKNLQQRR